MCPLHSSIQTGAVYQVSTGAASLTIRETPQLLAVRRHKPTPRHMDLSLARYFHLNTMNFTWNFNQAFRLRIWCLEVCTPKVGLRSNSDLSDRLDGTLATGGRLRLVGSTTIGRPVSPCNQPKGPTVIFLTVCSSIHRLHGRGPSEFHSSSCLGDLTFRRLWQPNCQW